MRQRIARNLATTMCQTKQIRKPTFLLEKWVNCYIIAYF